MKSGRLGSRTSAAEVLGITRNGIWLLVDDREYFLAFAHFPWFETAPVRHVLNVGRPSAGHLYWPDLDVDLDIESIEHPERFPLVSEKRPRYGSPRATRKGKGVHGKPKSAATRRR